MPITKINDHITTAGQLQVEEIPALAEQGFSAVITNRPDGEGGPDQPASAELRAAVEAAGMNYHYLPVIPQTLDPSTVEAFAEVMTSAQGGVYAHCASGARSTILWALAEVVSGRDIDEIIGEAVAAGRDLAGAKPLMQAFQQAGR